MGITKNSIKSLRPGVYVADIRADEGVRVRKDFISPCLHTPQGGAETTLPMVIEVEKVGYENKQRNKAGLD